MMMRAQLRATALAAAIAIVAWAMPAGAQNDPAAALRQTVERWIGALNAQIGVPDAIRTSGPIAVRIDGDAAVATILDVTVAVPDGTLRLGTIAIAQREVAGGRLRYEASLPHEVRFDATGVGRTVTIRDGRAAVELDPRTNAVYGEQGHIEGLVVRYDGMPDQITAGVIEFEFALEQRADGLVDAPFRFELARLRIDEPNVRSTIALNTFAIVASLRGFKLSDYERLSAATVAALGAGSPDDLAEMVEQWLALPFASAASELTIADFAYDDGGASRAMAIGRAVLSQTADSLANPQTTYRARYSHQGVAVRADQLPYAQYVPSALDFDVAIDGMPSEELRDALSSAAGSLDTSTLVDFFDTVLTTAIEHGATARIAPLEWVSEILAVSGTATLTGNDQSPLSAVGTADLTIRGLDEVARDLFGDPQQAGPDTPAAIVARLSALGQQGTGPDGRPARTYHVELTPEGRVMFNGTDMSALFNGGGDQQPPQPTPPGK